MAHLYAAFPGKLWVFWEDATMFVKATVFWGFFFCPFELNKSFGCLSQKALEFKKFNLTKTQSELTFPPLCFVCIWPCSYTADMCGRLLLLWNQFKYVAAPCAFGLFLRRSQHAFLLTGDCFCFLSQRIFNTLLFLSFSNGSCEALRCFPKFITLFGLRQCALLSR